MVKNRNQDIPIKTETKSIGVPIFPTENKDEFYSRLKLAWSESTSLANWAMTEYIKRDVVRTPDMEKLPKWEEPYLYDIWNHSYEGRSWWNGAAQSASCLLQFIRRKYKAERYQILFQRRRSLATFRYPFPYPVHNQNWKLRTDNGRMIVSFSLPGGRVECALRGGQEFRRQLATLRKTMTGEVKGGELRVCQGRKEIMARFSVTFPVASNTDATNVLLVKTDPNALWVAELSGRQQPWILNADHIFRLQKSYQYYLQRMSEDLKYEKNTPRAKRKNMLANLDERRRKYEDRLLDFCHQASAQLIGFARRNKVREIIYDDQIKDYISTFPWFKLKEKVEYKAAHSGIDFTYIEGKQDEQTQGD